MIEGLVPFVVAVAVASQAPAAPRPPAVVIPPGKPTIVLWPDGAPGSEAHEGEPEQIDGETVLNVHAPSIIAFPPRPFDVEGLADMQRAIRTVRSRAAEFGVDPAKIGAAGFSAGGELAQLAALRHDAGRAEAADPVERVSSRPDFQVLIYPGKSALIQPVAGSPPAFLAAGYDDRPDISEGLAEAYLRFRKAGVQAELHMYANVGHGFGVRPERAGACLPATSLVRRRIARRWSDHAASRTGHMASISSRWRARIRLQ